MTENMMYQKGLRGRTRYTMRRDSESPASVKRL